MRTLLFVCAFVSAAAAWSAAEPVTEPRTPEAILAEFDAVKTPGFYSSGTPDPESVKRYEAQRTTAMERRATLALELYKTKPEHPRAAEVMSWRWIALLRTDKTDAAIEETESFVKEGGSLAHEAGFLHAYLVAEKHESDAEKSLPAIDAFARAWPGDDRAANLLSRVGQGAHGDGKVAVWERILKDYPTSDEAALAPGQIRQVKGLGKPFELAFNDVVTGVEVDISKSKGTIFVIDFWATWCSPCKAEMPRNKELYAKYRGQGVQFIGVSHDNAEHKGGKKALLNYVKDNDVRWPQYYQGNGRNSEFSLGWGVRAIPTVFVVDAEGNLHSTEARDELETMIPELIGRRDRAKAGAPGEAAK